MSYWSGSARGYEHPLSPCDMPQTPSVSLIDLALSQPKVTKTPRNSNQHIKDKAHSTINGEPMKSPTLEGSTIVQSQDEDDDYLYDDDEEDDPILRDFQFHKNSITTTKPKSSNGHVIPGFHILRKTFAVSQANKPKYPCYDEISSNEDNEVTTTTTNSSSTQLSKIVHDWHDNMIFNDCKAARRVHEILNRCYYLYSKNGLDSDSFLQHLRADEQDEKIAEQQLRDEHYEIYLEREEMKYFGATKYKSQHDPTTSHFPGIEHINIHARKQRSNDFVLPPINEKDPNHYLLRDSGKMDLTQQWLNSKQKVISDPPSPSPQYDAIFKDDEALHSHQVPQSAAGTFTQLLASHYKNNKQRRR